MHNLSKVLLRAGVSIGLLALLLFSVDITALVVAVARIRFTTVLYCMMLISVGVLVSVLKWKSFLALHSINHGTRSLVRLYMIGLFFNNLLPTSVGGDFVRAILASRGTQLFPEVLTTIFAERFSGLFAVACYGVIGLFLTPSLLNVKGSGLILAGFVIVALSLGVLTFWSRARLAVLKYLPEKISELCERCALCLRLYAGNRPVLLQATWTSFFFQILVAATYFVVAKDLAVDIGFGALLAVVSLVTLLTVLPVSLNGLGLREFGFVYLLGHFGIKSADAVALSLTVYSIVMIFSLIGWVVFVRWQRENPGLILSANK